MKSLCFYLALILTVGYASLEIGVASVEAGNNRIEMALKAVK